MISASDLPLVNALLNSCSAAFLVLGHRFMKKGNIAAHRVCMMTVFFISALFLASYLVYHYQHGSEPFRGEGWIRPVYFSVLLSHTVLAAAIVPLAIVTLRRGLKGSYELHRRIAKWTYPIWLYVSITGVVIYVMLYQVFR